VVEQPGVIRVLVNGRLRQEPFLDIHNLVKSGGEQGLLSMAFHPRYARNHLFYVDYTNTSGDTRVVEYRSRGLSSTPRRTRQILAIDQPYENHNGGQLAFGPDGYLYVGMGDGGSGGDPQNRAQNLGSLLGKLLRLNVGIARPRPVIVGYGLRNPWRFSWDRRTRDLYIGDVGEGDWEEVDVRTPRQQRLLSNYGWRVWEGRTRFTLGQRVNPRGRLVFPIATYSHDTGCSVTGGYVYRGAAVPAAVGRYFFGDYCNGRLWSFRVSGSGRASPARQEPFSVPSLSSFGEDARGELYATSLEGALYKLGA
jgi:glucose/arabinose dehydrogenase